MPGKRGSVLTITTGFVLIFTLLGFESIFLTGLNRERVQKQIASTKAFWLAEAGLEKAFSQLPADLSNGSETLDANGVTQNFSFTKEVLTPGERWLITSTGFVSPSTKKVQAEVGANVINPFQTTGYLKNGSEDQIEGSYTEHNDPFIFSNIFQKSELEVQNMAQILTNPKNNPTVLDDGTTPLQNGVIWVNGDLTITSQWNYEGILVVNGKFTMTGGSFQGVVWVNGSANMIEGNPGVTGAVFVNDPSDGQTKIDSNSAHIVYSEQAIDTAFGFISSPSPSTFHNLVNWKEID
ncbi:MAG: hypothetical protein PHN57_00955 [Candidatus Omnitrophica bacterium]|nr:hypothetical protein [Candidatus Omnitrophota bacterium]